MQVLVHSSDLVVVVKGLSFGALLVSWRGSPAVRLIYDPFTIAIIAAVALHHGKWSLTTRVTLMSAVAAEARRGHLVVTGFSNPLQGR